MKWVKYNIKEKLYGKSYLKEEWILLQAIGVYAQRTTQNKLDATERYVFHSNFLEKITFYKMMKGAIEMRVSFLYIYSIL